MEFLLSPSVSRRLPIKRVRYGDKRLWNSLSLKEKPFFQAIDGKADWKVEQEYRIVGDLSLRTLKQRDLVVFSLKRQRKQMPYKHILPGRWCRSKI